MLPRVATAPAAPPSPGAYLRLILISALIGIPAALVAVLFLGLVTKLQEWLWQDLPDQLGHSSPPWYLVVFLPVAGAVVVVIARRFLPGDGGHDPIEGLNASPTLLAAGPGVALAALGTLGFGAVLGPEAPLIALGSVVGLAVTPFIRLGDQGERVVGTAGAASAVSAVFGGPLVAGFLLMEVGVGMGSMLIPALLPALVAAATGYAVILSLDNWGRINEAGLSVPDLPVYADVSVRDMLIAVVVGVAAAIVMAVVHRIGVRTGGLRTRRFGMAALLLAGGLAVGLLAQTAGALGADTQDVLFSGQDSLPGADRRGLGARAAGDPGGQGHRVRHLPRLRLSRRPGVPGDLPRGRPDDVRRDRVRCLADARGRGGRGRGHGGRHAAPVRVAAVRPADRGHGRARGHARGGAGRRRRLCDRRGARAPEPADGRRPRAGRRLRGVPG